MCLHGNFKHGLCQQTLNVRELEAAVFGLKPEEDILHSTWQLMEMEMEMEIDGYEKRNGSEKVKENNSNVKERKRNVSNLKLSFHLQMGFYT